MNSRSASVPQYSLTTNTPGAYPEACLLADQLPDVVCVVNEEGFFTLVSAAARRLWGFLPQEMTGRSYMEFTLHEDVAQTKTSFVQSREEPFCSCFTSRNLRKDGIVVHVSWSVRWHEAARAFYCVARDGGPQKAIEQRLLKAQVAAGLANFEFDVASSSFTYISDNIYSLLGVEQQPGGAFSVEQLCRLIHPQDAAQVRSEMLHPNEKPDRSLIYYRIIRPDGTLVYLYHKRELLYNAAGHHVKTLGTLQDVTEEMQAKLALQQSEKRYRALVRGGHDMVGILSDKGIYTYIGENVERILGFSAVQMEGRSFTEFIHPEDLPEINQYYQLVLAGKQVSVPHFRFRSHNGQWRWMETRVTNLLHDPHINGLVINSRDVTEQKANHDKLRELSLIAQESTQAILITNTRHEITWVNRAFCASSGYGPADVLGKKPQDVFNPDASCKAEHLQVQQKLEQGLCVQNEMRFHDKAGSPYWMHLHVQPVYNEKQQLVQYLAIGQDITERKIAEAELALSEQRFKALVQEGSDLIVIVDKEGRFTYSSNSLRKVLGYEPAELLHQHLFSFIHPDDVADTVAGIERVKNNAATGGVRHRFRRKDGGYAWLESKGTNHFDNPVIRGMIVNARDINDQVLLQHKLDEELRNKQKEITSAVIKAQESERSKLGLELHDNVNQVLTTVKLYNEMYLSGYKKDRTLLERSTRYLQDCINEIRSISKRLSAPTLGKITLQDSIQDLVDSINLTNKLHIFLCAEGVEQLFIAEDMHLGIYRIVQESLNNVIKYAQASVVEIFIGYSGGILSLTIKDDGRGFDLKAKRKGIGITNMKTRAESLNGVFLLHTAAGSGCTVEVSFLV